MIVIDTSALVAMYRREEDSFSFFKIIRRSASRVLPPSCIVEFRMLHRYGGDRKTWLSALIEAHDVKVPSFTLEMAAIAAEAAERYGRGVGHRARLNFGDCMAYAVAKFLEAPLLYKGDDFRIASTAQEFARCWPDQHR